MNLASYLSMLILIDNGISHNFISSHFVNLAQLPIIPTKARKVKLANGEWLVIDHQVSQLPWYCQGHTMSTDLIVLDMQPYDAILGIDWIQAHSPMQCD
jgi:hypothetical protein